MDGLARREIKSDLREEDNDGGESMKCNHSPILRFAMGKNPTRMHSGGLRLSLAHINTHSETNPSVPRYNGFRGPDSILIPTTHRIETEKNQRSYVHNKFFRASPESQRLLSNFTNRVKILLRFHNLDSNDAEEVSRTCESDRRL